jgi:hypothetical protein
MLLLLRFATPDTTIADSATPDALTATPHAEIDADVEPEQD